jgi:drug/metabolite transporter (DMT)-like permease
MRFRVHLALFTVALLFSANYIISKYGMRELAPLSFTWLRVAGSAVLLWLLARRQDAPPLSRADSRRMIGFAILAVVLNQTLFLSGLALTTVQTAAILITAIPVFTAAVAIGLKREHASAARIGGIALACAGALLVVGGEGLSGTTRSLLGALMIVANCLCYAIYLVLSKPDMARLSALTVVARMFVVGALLMIPIAAVPLAREDWGAVGADTWTALALSIIFPSVIAYLLQAWALRHADSSAVASYVYVQPVLATVLGAAFFGERLRPVLLVAAAMIFTGVWIVGRRTM